MLRSGGPEDVRVRGLQVGISQEGTAEVESPR